MKPQVDRNVLLEWWQHLDSTDRLEYRLIEDHDDFALADTDATSDLRWFIRFSKKNRDAATRMYLSWAQYEHRAGRAF